MIDIKELRIGNFVNVKHPHPEDGVYSMQVNGFNNEEIETDGYGTYYGMCDASIDAVTPIPISAKEDEWLIKADFKLKKHGGRKYYSKDVGGNMFVYFNSHVDSGVQIEDFNCMNCQSGVYEIYVIENIEYLHQLQNIWYILSGGEELEFKNE